MTIFYAYGFDDVFLESEVLTVLKKGERSLSVGDWLRARGFKIISTAYGYDTLSETIRKMEGPLDESFTGMLVTLMLHIKEVENCECCGFTGRIAVPIWGIHPDQDLLKRIL